MSPEEYLTRVRNSLKGLPEGQREIILEEIAGHLSEIQVAGGDPVEMEMGAPEDLARRLKNVHHPRRWIDYLLVVLPDLLLSSTVISLLSILLFPTQTVSPDAPGMSQAWGMRMLAFSEIILIVVSMWRRRHTGQPDVLLYWLPAAWLTIFSLCYREKRWLPGSMVNTTTNGVVESIFWLILLLGLAVWLLRMLWCARDPQLVALALLPFLVMAGNVAVGSKIMIGGFPGGYNLPPWRIGYWFGLPQAALIVWPALYYLTHRRPVRWLGLLVRAAPLAMMNMAASVRYPAIAAVWSLPVLLVLAGWLIDRPIARRPSGLPQ